MRTIIDSHQHIWDVDRADYLWLKSAAAVLHRTLTMEDALPHLHAAGLGGTILVQSADNDENPEVMLEVGRRTAEVVGVVGYPETAAARLATLQLEPLFCGVRNLIHNQPDLDWLLHDDVDVTLGLLEKAGVPLDVAGVLLEHLRAVLTISEKHPNLHMILDRLNRAPVGAKHDELWLSLIAQVAKNPLVFGKLSGLYSVVGQPAERSVATIRPVFEHALEHFGAERLLCGGDWPISLIAGGYDRVWGGISELLSDLDLNSRSRILSANAIDFYSLKLSKE